MKELELKVEGMVCGGCENRVKNALSLIDGIESVEASHKTGMVELKLNKDVERKLIEEKIENLGFEVVKED